VPQAHAEALETALFNAGAGNIGNYSENCSFTRGWHRKAIQAIQEPNPVYGQNGETHYERESTK